ncbi:peptide chain release factor N(5)-glutamine methyltransferase [Emticicia sp. TH156]|uniref:peptide chain release factor N(5)-glutamine methyltransferase n=1 Tax=Emticicia sp. TH156 TaxID=2067454 RepID=UPI001E4D0B42|nr:peptide chain release factor N(5)-glutamine methyltransferase [Emticicia sp. TH156]
MKDSITAKQLFDQLLHQITVYETQEAKEIVFWLLEHELNLRKIDILTDKPINTAKKTDWATIIDRLNKHEPIQYILGETTFYGRRFLVDKPVLIPRPETEELVALVCEWEQTAENKPEAKMVLDIGTGSGCIAVSLAKELNDARVTAYDISEEALVVARKNAMLNMADVSFERVDILRYLNKSIVPEQAFDVIVSNPPYVTRQEAAQMRQNVLEFEPHLALFVADTEPLVFYEAIARFASKALKDGGLLAVEINENLGSETATVFMEAGFTDVAVVQDIHRKNRFVRASISKKTKNHEGF